MNKSLIVAGLLTTVVSTSGCFFGGSSGWSKPQQDNNQQYYQDLSQCQVMANQANNDDVLDNCMRGKGYTKD